jgi:hypothetical protein
MPQNKKRPQQLLLDEILYPESCFVQSWRLMASGRVDYEETVQTIGVLQKPNLNAETQRKETALFVFASLRRIFPEHPHLCRRSSLG